MKEASPPSPQLQPIHPLPPSRALSLVRSLARVSILLFRSCLIFSLGSPPPRHPLSSLSLLPSLSSSPFSLSLSRAPSSTTDSSIEIPKGTRAGHTPLVTAEFMNACLRRPVIYFDYALHLAAIECSHRRASADTSTYFEYERELSVSRHVSKN